MGHQCKSKPTSVSGGKECDRHFSVVHTVLEHTNESLEEGYREVKIIKVNKRGFRGVKVGVVAATQQRLHTEGL